MSVAGQIAGGSAAEEIASLVSVGPAGVALAAVLKNTLSLSGGSGAVPPMVLEDVARRLANTRLTSRSEDAIRRAPLEEDAIARAVSESGTPRGSPQTVFPMSDDENEEPLRSDETHKQGRCRFFVRWGAVTPHDEGEVESESASLSHSVTASEEPPSETATPTAAVPPGEFDPATSVSRPRLDTPPRSALSAAVAGDAKGHATPPLPEPATRPLPNPDAPASIRSPTLAASPPTASARAPSASADAKLGLASPHVDEPDAGDGATVAAAAPQEVVADIADDWDAEEDSPEQSADTWSDDEDEEEEEAESPMKDPTRSKWWNFMPNFFSKPAPAPAPTRKRTQRRSRAKKRSRGVAAAIASSSRPGLRLEVGKEEMAVVPAVARSSPGRRTQYIPVGGSSLKISPPMVPSTPTMPTACMSRFATDFVEVALLGSGGFGKVFKCLAKLDGQMYAIKRVLLQSRHGYRRAPDPSNVEAYLNELSPETRRQLKEAHMLARMGDHPNIIRYYTSWVEWGPMDEGENDTFDTPTPPRPTNRGVLSNESSGDLSAYRSARCENSERVNLWELRGGKLASSVQENIIFGPFTPELAIGKFSDDGSDVGALSPGYDDTDDVAEDGAIFGGKPHVLYLYLQMQYCNSCSMRQWLENPTREVDTQAILGLFVQVVSGLQHVHQHKVIHRDLKPDNIFMLDSGRVMIGDFGLATSLHQPEPLPGNAASQQLYLTEQALKSPPNSSGLGSALYAAPEQLAPILGKEYDEKADIWSLGAILVEMFCHPFKTQMERHQTLMALRVRQLPSHFSAAVRDLAVWLLAEDPSCRPTTSDILSHKLIQNFVPTLGTTPHGTPSSPSPRSYPTLGGLVASPPRFPPQTEESIPTLRDKLRERDERIMVQEERIKDLERMVEMLRLQMGSKNPGDAATPTNFCT